MRVVEGNSGTANAVITLKADRPMYGYLDYYTVDGTATAGKDFGYVWGSVYFNNETEKQIVIPIIGDIDVEPDETFRVHLSPYSYFGYALARTDITVTIANDDVGVGPATQNVAKGSSGQVIVDVGTPPGSQQTITIAANDPCIKAPASAVIAGGSHTAVISVLAVTAPCSARIDVTLPQALGGRVLSAGIRTYTPLELVFDPPSPTVYVGQTLNVRVTASPLDGTVALPLTAVGGTAEVPASVNVGPTGGTLGIKGVKAGALVVFITLPSQNGGGTAILSGDVADAPTTVTISRLSPASGPSAGGTSVTLSGANFHADCSLLFGGVPATDVAFVNSSSMTAVTPAHAAGAVDVAAMCGAESFTLAGAFTYVAAGLTITGVTPSFGSIVGGTTVSIAGRDFAPECWAFFDGAAAHNVSVPGTTQMIATAPPHPAGAVAVSVRCRAAQASLADAFSYSTDEEPAAVITSVAPLAAAPGQLVTIDGSRFRVNDRVTFDTAGTPLISTTPDTHVVSVLSLPLG